MEKSRDNMPPQLMMNKRDWQSYKRQQARLVKKAISDLREGCYYTPVADEIDELEKLADVIVDKLSVRKWKKLRGDS